MNTIEWLRMAMQIAVALASCLLLVMISVLYFRLGSVLTLRIRIAASAHAALVATILPYGLFIDAATSGYAPIAAQLPILVLLLLAAASMAFSVWVFRDKPLLHLVHLVTIALALPLTFIGAVAVGGWT
jgi:hypothetical protein